MFHNSSLYDFVAAALMIFVGLMIFYYVSKRMTESACENCASCSYRGENFVRREVTSNDLSKISMGLSL
jgi:hypothetical protein